MNNRRQTETPKARRPRPEEQPVTVERIERSMVMLAHIIGMDGDKYLPIYERLEKELEILKQKENALARARTFLEANAHRFPELNLKHNNLPEKP